jgi:hypothetical protein
MAAAVLHLPHPAVAQVEPPVTAARIADSAGAVTAACGVVQALRPEKERYRCRVESYEETATEYVVRVREQAPPGAATLVFGQSEVHFPKAERSVVVTRVPDL